jgi:glycosyltransferase involved in cell wall biosynthesis
MDSSLALCIPAYNAENYLPRLLSSAQSQTIPFDEILVYDDCSTDNTAEIAEKYGAKVIRGEINRGCSFGKNVLANNTSCDWIHFHDADDELYSNFTTLAKKWMGYKNTPHVVLFNYEYRENTTYELIGNREFSDIELIEDPIKYTIKNQVNPFCGLYNRQSLIDIGGYDINPEVLYNEDVAFHCKLAISGLKFRAESEISIINYRVQNSMSAINQVKCAKAHFNVMKRNIELVGQKYSIEISQKLWQNAIFSASLNDWETCKKSLRLASSLNKQPPKYENWFVKFISYVDPYLAIFAREKMIRLFKSHLRRKILANSN